MCLPIIGDGEVGTSSDFGLIGLVVEITHWVNGIVGVANFVEDSIAVFGELFDEKTS